MRIVIQIVLAIAIVVLTYLVWESIAEPIRFQDAKEKREAKVIQRLKDIRTAQLGFQQKYERFTGSWDTLILFMKHDSIYEVIKEGMPPDTLTELDALKMGLIKRDTIKVLALEGLFHKGYNIDSICYVPNTGGVKFDLFAGFYTTSDGNIKVPIFEAATTFSVYLKGLSNQEIVNLKLERKRLNQFDGLKVGTREEPNNHTGNWVESKQ